MKVDLIPVKEKQKSILSDLLRQYQQELSKFREANSDENGTHVYKYLDSYWKESDRHAFFIKADNSLAGFVMINKYNLISQGAWSVAEFFVLKNYRNKGIGKEAAFKLFAKFSGNWEISQMENNEEAQKFWRKIIKEYTNNNHKELLIEKGKWKGVIQTFVSKKV